MDKREFARFETKIEYRGECWLWTGAINANTGYGAFSVKLPNNKWNQRGAHRIAYAHWVGPIPVGLWLDHLCRVRRCVNPKHLEPVTPRENILRGEGSSADRARQTHCLRGHEFTPENTYRPQGTRQCRECKRERDRNYRKTNPKKYRDYDAAKYRRQQTRLSRLSATAD